MDADAAEIRRDRHLRARRDGLQSGDDHGSSWRRLGDEIEFQVTRFAPMAES